MPSIIEGYNYDIFISYRQKDNKYDGWVTEFVSNLQWELEATFKEEISVYFDINSHDGLLETHDVDESLKEKLKCLIFIPIISRTYCDPKSFAWEHEFKAFVEQASNDRFGLKIRLSNGNVASRVLPVSIHDLDDADIKLCETALGGVLRGIEFIYKEPGVNKPLTADDDEKKNLNKTKYRIQINRIANAIKEVLQGMKGEPAPVVKERTREIYTDDRTEGKKEMPVKPAGLSRRRMLITFIVTGILILVAGIIIYPRLFIKPPTTNMEKSLAVMSFKNLTGDTINNVLADIHHEASLYELGKISQVKPLRIVGPRTTLALEKNRSSLSKITRDARLDYLIEGSVFGSGKLDEIIITLTQIFPEERVIWNNKYSSDRKNIFALHNTIAEQIAQKIGLDLLPQDIVKLPQPRLINPKSFELYIQGTSEIEKATDSTGNIKGLNYLHESVRIAPEDAFANAGLAFGYLTIAHSPLDPGDALIKGEEYAMKAMKLDSNLAEVHAALAQAYLYKSWKFEESEKHFKIALKLNPNLDMAHYHYSWGLYLWDRMEEAITEHKLAQKCDPYNPLHTAWLGELYRRDGRYEEAVQEANKALEIQKDFHISYLVLGHAYLDMGRKEEAIKIHQKLTELYPNFGAPYLCITYLSTGHREEAEKILHEIEKWKVTPIVAFHLANIYAAFGRKDEAFKWLNYEPHHAWTAWAAKGLYKQLHDDPRWDEFVRKLNLPKKITE